MTILVTGATGNVGRQVVAQLLAAGAPVRALTRNPASANLPEGAEVVAGDLTNTESLAKVFEGVTAAHLINFGGDDYALLPNGEEIVKLALNAGVTKVTLLSGWERSSIDHAVEASSLEWTRLMPGEFMANALGWAKDIRETGVIHEPFADGHAPMSHEADIAAVAVVALLTDGNHGKTYSVTAPTPVSLRDKVRIIGEVIGKETSVVELSEQEARDRMAAKGEPQEMIDFKIRVFGDLPKQPYPLDTTEFENLVGRLPYDFARWVADHAEAFTG